MNPSIEPASQWTNEGFNQVFDGLIKTGIPYIQAYTKAEEMHVEKFGRIRYKSYQSFRNSRKKLLFGI